MAIDEYPKHIYRNGHPEERFRVVTTPAEEAAVNQAWDEAEAALYPASADLTPPPLEDLPSADTTELEADALTVEAPPKGKGKAKTT